MTAGSSDERPPSTSWPAVAVIVVLAAAAAACGGFLLHDVLKPPVRSLVPPAPSAVPCPVDYVCIHETP